MHLACLCCRTLLPAPCLLRWHVVTAHLRIAHPQQQPTEPRCRHRRCQVRRRQRHAVPCPAGCPRPCTSPPLFARCQFAGLSQQTLDRQLVALGLGEGAVSGGDRNRRQLAARSCSVGRHLRRWPKPAGLLVGLSRRERSRERSQPCVGAGHRPRTAKWGGTRCGLVVAEEAWPPGGGLQPCGRCG